MSLWIILIAFCLPGKCHPLRVLWSDCDAQDSFVPGGSTRLQENSPVQCNRSRMKITSPLSFCTQASPPPSFPSVHFSFLYKRQVFSIILCRPIINLPLQDEGGDLIEERTRLPFSTTDNKVFLHLVQCSAGALSSFPIIAHKRQSGQAGRELENFADLVAEAYADADEEDPLFQCKPPQPNPIMHLRLWRKGAVGSWWWLQMNSEAIQPNPSSIYHSDNPSSIYQSDIASPISQSNCPSFIFQSNSYIACSKIYQKIKTGSANFLSLFRQTQQRATQQESQIQNHSMQTALCIDKWRPDIETLLLHIIQGPCKEIQREWQCSYFWQSLGLVEQAYSLCFVLPHN